MIGVIHRFESFPRFTSTRHVVGSVGRWCTSVASRIGSDKSRFSASGLGEAGCLGIDRSGSRITFGNLSDDFGSGLTVDRRTLDDGLVFGILSTSVGYIRKVAYDWVTPSSSSRNVGESCSVGSRRSSEGPRSTLGDDGWSPRCLSNGLILA